MKEIPSFLPVENGELHDFEVTYLDAKGVRQVYPLQSKAAPNALRSFDRAVRDHGRILGLKKVKQ